MTILGYFIIILCEFYDGGCDAPLKFIDKNIKFQGQILLSPWRATLFCQQFVTKRCLLNMYTLAGASKNDVDFIYFNCRDFVKIEENMF